MPGSTSNDWHAQPGAKVAVTLDADPLRGLATAEAARRRLARGANEIADRATRSWRRVLAHQFADALIAILIAAAVVAWLVGDAIDALAIVVIVVLNATLGFVQEWKAERAMAAMRTLLAPRCRVLRDGTLQVLDAAALVPGDTIRLETGDRVPADVRLLEGIDLAVDESALTGESVPVDKTPDPVAVDTPLAERTSMAFLGTAVVNGHAQALVVATGAATELGRVAALTAAVTQEATPLQLALGRLGRQLGVAALGVAALVALAGWLGGEPLVSMFLTGVSLAVAIVPEGLPAVVTISLALGVRAMARRRALVRRLRAVEALGATTVLCTDKTGTLTENRMTVRSVWLPGATWTFTPDAPSTPFRVGDSDPSPQVAGALRRLLRTAALCNHAELGDGTRAPRGNPTELALLVAAAAAGCADRDVEVVAERSFDARRKRMSVVVRDGDALVAHVKGAPEAVLACSTSIADDAGGNTGSAPLDAARRARVDAAYTALAEGGLRVLALATRTVGTVDDDAESGLTFLGLVGMVDPPRAEVAAAVRRARDAGLRVFVVTGDAAPTARAIATEIGLDVRTTLCGPALDAMEDAVLADALRSGGVLFARTTPEQKLRLVDTLQADGEVVAMTGDGVNDAPALKKADVGVAMGRRGTGVAQGAADLVLTDDDFTSIVDAIEEGRRQFDNLRKFLANLLSSNIGEVVALVAAIAIGGPLVFLPAQLLWINLVTDGLPSLALGAEPAEPDVMRRPPRRARSSPLDRGLIVVILLHGIWIGLGAFALFEHQLANGASLVHARSVAFTAIVIGELVNAWNYRSLRVPLARLGVGSNGWFLAAFGASIALQVTALGFAPLRRLLHVEPIGVDDWLGVLVLAVPLVAITECVKAWRARPGRNG